MKEISIKVTISVFKNALKEPLEILILINVKRVMIPVLTAKVGHTTV